MGDLMETIVDVVGLVLVVVSLLFAAVQTRELAKQTRLNNGITRVTATSGLATLTQGWYQHLVRDPSLRPYFFAGRSCPPRGDERAVLVSLAELLADVLEGDLRTTALLPGFDFAQQWHEWPAHMLRNSPVLVEVVEAHPAWWPALRALQQSLDGVADGPVPHPLVEVRRPGRIRALLRRPPLRSRPTEAIDRGAPGSVA
ncbi:hypothetical protein [Plantactinospora sp. B5E13]|uniref:hypothetical protein n=1 Tax=Plantactinospora sp. B5E13 TaxID=3153758 RepID=UPI00325C98EB